MKQRLIILAALIAAFCILAQAPAFAQSADDGWDADIGLNSLRAGREMHERGKFQEALLHYDRAIESGMLKGENRAIAYNNRANVFADLGRFEEAVADYSEAIGINSAFIEAYYNRGIGRYELGEYLGAIDDFNKTIELSPGYASAYYNRSFPLEGLGRYLEAIRDVGRAIAMRPQEAYYKARLLKLQALARKADQTGE